MPLHCVRVMSDCFNEVEGRVGDVRQGAMVEIVQ